MCVRVCVCVLSGMDLRPSDFEWITTEIMRIADLCCSGRVVSVLEGGYGTHTIKRTHTDEKEKEKEADEEVQGVVKVEVEVNDGSALIPSLDSLPSCTISDTSLPISLSIPSLASLPDSNSDTLSDSHTESESPPVDTPPHSGKKSTHCRSGMDRDVLAMSVAAHVRRLVDPYGPHVRINSSSPTPPIDILSSCAPSYLPPTAASPTLSHSVSLLHPATALTPTSASAPVPAPVPSSSSAIVTSDSSLHSPTPDPSHPDIQSQQFSQPLCATKVLPYIDVEDSHSESLNPSKEKIIGLQNDDFIEAAQCSLSTTQEGQQFQSPT